eukprot:TRINITY_DN4435_c0_g1_i1.p1 TRINITY_DN4435_c0_g1~~TRINITY_DN4435_c0_g1_i1.p1  ORF type:complete len:393 (+),score=144.02 TRINITY_DN4435_c0_g1_i1:140-1180(+)
MLVDASNNSGPANPSKSNKKAFLMSDDDTEESDEEFVEKRPLAYLFPGQGSQTVGMLKSIADLPKVKELARISKDILGYDLLDMCINGPDTDLNNTVHAQPALLLASICAVAKMDRDDSVISKTVKATAGLSLGEYSALVFAGSLSFEDAMRLVRVRAESMQAATEIRRSGMVSVAGLKEDKIRELCKVVCDENPGCICQPSNFLFPKGIAVGTSCDIQQTLMDKCTEAGALKAMALRVSGAFHTSLMSPASDALRKALDGVKITMPKIDVYSNVTAKPYSSVEEIRATLVRQLVEPVQWEKSMKNLIASGINEFVELGPRAQLKAMMKRNSLKAWKATKNVDVTK